MSDSTYRTNLTDADIATLERALKTTFGEKQVLRSALTHRSYLNEHRFADWEHNERLEFLGDAVLELIMTDYLYRTYPDKPEGELTAIRAALVNTHTLAEVADHLQVNDYLLMSRGEAKDSGRARQYILANTFEALIGAIYIDQGYDAARSFVAAQLFDRVETVVTERLWQDPKSRFQELAQEHASVTPQYETLSQSGPDHDRVFTVGVFLRQEKVAEGEGRSKQEAEQAAAKHAILAQGWA
jgi:ribonuclease-3